MTTLFLVVILFFAWTLPALAHCPLCTVGAGIAAGVANYLGVSEAVIGVFIGAFGVAVGSWISNIWKAEFKWKKEVLITGSFLGTVLPLMYMFSDVLPLYIDWYGGYGTLLNRTYLINQFLLGSILAGALVVLAPYISKLISRKRDGVMWPYQGLSITFGSLLLLAFIFELWI